jgi:hypothetical protein
MRDRLLISLRSILLGWGTLLVIAFLLERPLLIWTAPVLGVRWYATAGLALDCAALATTGWVVGRLNLGRPVLAVLVFAATLTFRDLTPALAINIPWLLHLVTNALNDRRYLSPLVDTAATQALLFGCLVAGGLLSRPAQTKPPSIISGIVR